MYKAKRNHTKGCLKLVIFCIFFIKLHILTTFMIKYYYLNYERLSSLKKIYTSCDKPNIFIALTFNIQKKSQTLIFFAILIKIVHRGP